MVLNAVDPLMPVHYLAHFLCSEVSASSMCIGNNSQKSERNVRCFADPFVLAMIAALVHTTTYCLLP